MRAIIFILLICLAVPATVHGDLFLDLEYTDMTTAKTVSSGDVVMLNLILRDPSDDTFLSLEGLGSGGGALIQTGGTIALAPSVPPVNGPEFDPLFTVPGSAAARPGLVDSVLVGAPFLPAGLGTTDVLLATFLFGCNRRCRGYRGDQCGCS